MSQITRRQMLSGSIAIAAFGNARPAMADAPAPFAIDEVSTAATNFLVRSPAVWPKWFRKRDGAGVCQTATFWPGGFGGLCRRPSLRRREDVYPKRGRRADILARTFARL